MATRIRTIDFLPEIFQTNTNDQFLSATLDQLVQPPDFKKVQGYIGSKFGYGVNSKDQYVKEPTIDKTIYQLEPTVVFTDSETGKITDAITYPGIIDALRLESGIEPNHNSLFKNEFYSWDSFVDLDKLINFGQYYWIPEGPESVDITTETVLLNATIKVISNINTYQFEINGALLPTENPTLTLVRGGTYTFEIDEQSKFYIQSLPGVNGVDPNKTNFSTREINGIDFNGISSGTFVYNVPSSDAQNDTKFPGRIPIDLVTTLSFNKVHGARLADLKNIDGVRDIAGKTLLFYGTSPSERASVGEFFDSTGFDINEYESFKNEQITSTVFTIAIVGNTYDESVIKLIPTTPIGDNTNIVINSGVEYINRQFVKNSYGEISLIPNNTSAISTLYYQDEANSNKFGKIKLIDKPIDAVIDVLDIIGKKNYTSPNGIKFSNGLRVKFVGRVSPTKYLTDSYYVEGVGTSIQLIPSSELIVSELYSQEFSAPFDDPASAFDQVGFGDVINLPYTPDYITISRNSIDRNGWSRGNRWFHVDVLKTIAENNLISPIVNKALSTGTNRASRPIIEFYPNLKLIYHGNFGKTPVDYIDTNTTDALNVITGINPDNYLPDGFGSSLFDGCRIIFAKDSNVEVRNKIFVATVALVNGSRVITLTKASDGDVSANDQVIIVNGVTNKGYNYYFDGDVWVNGQTKTTVNQAPLFDLFDSNGISLSDGNYYPGTDFKGCTLFQYSVGSGVKDSVLGLPIQYSGVGNLNDINFESTLNSQSFNYVYNNQSINEPVNYGYVYQYIDKTNYVRKLGWETAVDTSFQYQVFDFTYNNINTTNTFTLDVPLKDSTTTAWPTSVVYLNNSRINTYTTTINAKSTDVVITETLSAGDVITILAYSDVISNMGYYQIPSNLQQNPFNYQITTISAGDIRGHYKSICNNIPNLSGQSFGANNYRDLGNPVPYGTRIIQNSASMTTPAAFIRKQETNFFNSINYNATEYVKFKSLLVNTVNSQDYTPYDTASDMLDDALDIITSAKSQSSPFFWSDMLPSKTPNVVNTYTFAVGITDTVYPLSKVYNFTVANYESVLVYVSKLVNGIMQYTQMLKGVDYFVSTDGPYLVMSAQLNDGDTVTIKEYTQTYGSYIPSTPSKIGLYPVSIPEIILDETYINPTYFIKGHDGSLTKLYDGFDNYGNLIDFRDKVLFEFECRIYNNIKVDAKTPIVYVDIFPGQFRTTDYTYEQVMQLYTTSYLNWVGLNRIDTASQYYDSTNEYTWNYNKAKNKIDNTVLKQGNWRGIYMWFYDTATPHATPWEMLGLPVKPIWWDERYGLAPYTSDNKLLWTDLSNGYVYNNGNSYIDKNYVRPNLLDVLPVNSKGELLSPFESVVRNYNKSTFNNDWVIGDMGPAEYSYRKSSTWPFDLMRIFALSKPAQFFTLGLDLDVYKYNYEFNQYLVFNRFRTTGRQQLELYGHSSSSPAHSYMNWVIDYLYQYGLPGTTIIENLITYIDVRLSYRVSGYTDKNKINFYIEKGSPNSTNSSLIVPDDSYTILQYKNEPNDTIVYSSVIIQKTDNGYKVYGNSQNKTYFISGVPLTAGKQKLVNVLGLQVYVPVDFSANVQYTSYGHEFKNVTDLSSFLAGYGNYLISQGVVFDDVENNTVLDWNQMIAELLYWVQTGWEVGSVINLNPCSNNFHIEKPIGIIQPFTMYQNNFVLNQNLIPVNLNDLAIYRKDTTFKMKILTNGDTISYLRADVSIAEHIIIFDNETVFNDILYNLITGLRQQRLYVKGSKTNQWDGTLYAPGFIQNQNNVVDWKENTKYTKGTIVIYKRKYWMANKTVIVPSSTFDFNDWILTTYDKIDTGILANPNTRASESEYYYDIRRSNLQNDGDLLGFSLIGYRPRSYLADADLDDISQVNIYKNMISEKGTLETINSFQGATIQNNDLAYTINENWAIKNSEYGGVLNHNFVEFTLDESLLTGNPAIVSLIHGNQVDIAQQQVPLYNIKNYGRSVNTTSVLPTLNDSSVTSLPSAGYASLDDITLYSYTAERISNTVINLVYKNDYIWIADKQNDWNVYTPIGLQYVLTSLVNNLNDTCTLNFSDPHGLVQYDVIAVVNDSMNSNTIINGFYTVESVLSNKSVSINLSLPSNITNVMLDNPILLYKFQSMRVSSPTKINSLPLLNFEYTTLKVWVDQAETNAWAVYQKNINYYDVNFEIPDLNNGILGSAVAYLPQLGYYISDPKLGKVYKYIRSGSGTLKISTITKDPGFGTTMARNNEFMIVSQPSDIVSKLYIYRIVSLPEVSALVEEQVLTVKGTYAGTSMAFSGDSNYLLVGAPKVNSVIYFHRQVDYTLLPVLGRKQDTPLVCQLITETNPLDKFFVVDGNAVSSIPEGKRITFLQYKQLNSSVLLGIGYDGNSINLRINVVVDTNTVVTTSSDVVTAMTGYSKITIYNTNTSVYDEFVISNVHEEVDEYGNKTGVKTILLNTNYTGKTGSINATIQWTIDGAKRATLDPKNAEPALQLFGTDRRKYYFLISGKISEGTHIALDPTVDNTDYVVTSTNYVYDSDTNTTKVYINDYMCLLAYSVLPCLLDYSDFATLTLRPTPLSSINPINLPVWTFSNLLPNYVTVITGEYVNTIVDNFTGDGSATSFNLTTTDPTGLVRNRITTVLPNSNYGSPAYNYQNVVVTVDGTTINTGNYQLTQDTITFDTPPAKNLPIIITTTVDRTIIHTVERIGYSLSPTQLTATRNDVIVRDINYGSSYLSSMNLDNGNHIASTNIFISTVNNQFNFIGPIQMSQFDSYYLGKNPGNTSNANDTVLSQTDDNFGASIAVNYDASKIFIGSPTYHVRLVNNDTVPPAPNVGIVWVFDRLIETIKLEYTPDQLEITLPWALDNFLMSHTRITLNGIPLSTNLYNVRYSGQRPLIFFSKVLGIKAGDIITISSPSLVLSQALTSYENINDIIPNQQFGTSITTNSTGSEVLVGTPYDHTSPNQDGAVYRFTNQGKRYGSAAAIIVANLQPIVTSSQPVGAGLFVTGNTYQIASVGSTNFTSIGASSNAVGVKFKATGPGSGTGNALPVSTATILFINGYSVFLDFSNGLDAYGIASAINLTQITNIFAYVTEDDRLVIRLLNVDFGADNNKLNITAFNGNYFYLMGIAPYTKTQVIKEPHAQHGSMFGYRVAFNEHNSFVVTAPKANRYAATFFDMVSSEMHYNTVFDLNLTTFEDVFINAGAAYMYDYIKPYNETLLNSGQFIYSQPVNDTTLTYGALPLYGNSLSFNDNVVMIGSPGYKAEQVGGRVNVFENTYGAPNWNIYRNSTSVVDIEQIQKVQLYNNSTNENLASLDYIDPLRGKLLGAVRENLDYIGIADPAGYNNTLTMSNAIVWNINQVGKTWFNTSTTKFLNYHQNDLAYNAKYWGQIFPGSTVTVYTWIESDVTPAFYVGPGTPFSLQKYTTAYVVNSNNSLVQKYYYWVRNTNTIYGDKMLTDSILERYITSPQNSGIAYMAPLRSDTYALYNSRDYINGLYTNMHLGFSTSMSQNVLQNEFKLIQNNNPSDFLPGLPNYSLGHSNPSGLYNRLLESFVGIDETGASVPNYTLPPYLQTGIGVRPRQSMFIDRFGALKNYLTYANNVLAQYPINEFSNLTYLSTSNDYFNTSSYWSNIYWWANGYDNKTKTKVEVGIYADLYKLTATEGLIVGVAKNGQGKREVYLYTNDSWTRIGLQDGTIQFSDMLWDYQTNKIGFGDNFFDTESFDTFPAVETYYIIRALNEQIFIGPLLEHRNKSLILMFEYIQSENVSGHNYLPWLTKTSFADVTYTVRDLQQDVNYHVDNITLLSGYINEVKPYHTVIKDFGLRYTNIDTLNSSSTDFDVNAVYNSKTGKFISPQLSFTNPNKTKNEYAIGDSIWSNSNYTSWYNDYGLALNGIPGFEIGILKLYMTPTSNTLLIDNARGMPDAGVLYIDSEVIGYASVNRDTGVVSGLTRGIGNSYVSDHYPGIPILTDLPGVVVLDTGRGYNDPPTVTAYIDTTIYPAPTREAVLQPVMAGDRVIAVDILDPGENYAATPEIRFTSSYDVVFKQTNLNFINDTILVPSTILKTGDLIKSTCINGVGSIIDGYYYVYVIAQIEDQELLSITLHKTLNASLIGHDKIKLHTGTINEVLTGNEYQFSLTARAIGITTNLNVRSIRNTLRFDRTSYISKVIPWEPNKFWGSQYNQFGVSSVSSNVTLSETTDVLYNSHPYSNITGTTSPSDGTGATFTITNVLLGGTYNVVTTNSGHDYKVFDTITIPGTNLSGTSPANNCFVVVDSVSRFYPHLNQDTTTGSGTDAGFDITVSTSSVQLTGAVVLTNGSNIVHGTSACSFTGTIIGDTLTAIWISGTIEKGALITGTGVQSNTLIIAKISGSGTSGTSVWTVSINQQVSSTTMTSTGTLFTEVQPGFVLRINDNNKLHLCTLGTVATVETNELSADYNKLMTLTGNYTGPSGVYLVKYALSTYDAKINSFYPGQNYAPYVNDGVNPPTGDRIKITGDRLGGATPTNDLTINIVEAYSGKVVSASAVTDIQHPAPTTGSIKNIIVEGTALDSNFASLQGAVMPIKSVNNDNGVTFDNSNNVIVRLDYKPSRLSPGQIQGSKTYFYHLDAIPYVYNNPSDTGTYDSTRATIEVHRPRFNPYDVSQSYFIKITNSGSTHYAGEKIIISGTVFDSPSATPKNDVTITVNQLSNPATVGSRLEGGILVATVTGVSARVFDVYYIQPINSTEVQVFSDPGLKRPVKYNEFIYKNNVDLVDNTPINIMTGEDATLLDYNSTLLDNDPTNNITDFAYIPEPFTLGLSYKYDTSSIVSYANRIWRCIESNNDTVFDSTKWIELESGDRAINALDRIVAYYEPAINMPAKDLYQLVGGISYPGTVYYGNSFSPEDIIPIDVALKGQELYPRTLDIKVIITIIVDDTLQYIALGESADKSLLMNSNDGVTWHNHILAEHSLHVTDILYNGDKYLVSTLSTNNPILLSYNGLNWLGQGKSTLFDQLGYDDDNFDSSPESYPADSVNKIIQGSDGYYYGVGSFIARSAEGIAWDKQFTFGTKTINIIYDISEISTPAFKGFIAVGGGNKILSGIDTAAPVVTTCSIVITSIDGITWKLQDPFLTTETIKVIVSKSNIIIVAGNNGTIWYSVNGYNWIQTSSGVSRNLNAGIYANSMFILVGDYGTIITSTDGITWTEKTDNTLTVDNLNDVTYDGLHYYAVGNNATIIRSVDTNTWTSVSVLTPAEPNSIITGNDFLYGYGPEELIPGIITETLSLKVITSPGANWDNTPIVPTNTYYQHTSFGMKTVTSTTKTVSFDGVMRNPAQVSVFIIDSTTKLGNRIYTGYTVNWITKVVTLTDSLASGKLLMVEVYEVGNGKQISRGNSQHIPFRTNIETGNSEIYLSQPYTPLITPPVAYHNGVQLLFQVDYDYIYTEDINSSRIVFNYVYNQTTDYITWAILDTSVSDFRLDEVSYSIPQTQTFTNSTAKNKTLTNNISGLNTTNAIVEKNGLRLQPTVDYTIDFATSKLTLVSNPITSDTIAVTTFNETNRLFIETMVYTATTNQTVFAITQPVVNPNALTGATMDPIYYTDVNKAWVTINGYRIGSDKLSYDNQNNLTINATINDGDIVMVTVTLDGGTPNSSVFNIDIDKYGNSIVFRSNDGDGTWLTTDFNLGDTSIYVYNVNPLLDTIVQNTNVNTDTSGKIFAYIECDINAVMKSSVHNQTTSSDVTNYTLNVINGRAALVFANNSQASVNDSLTVTLHIGNILELNGEKIRFNSVDFVHNIISGLTRGVSGTGTIQNNPKYTEIYGLTLSRTLDPKFYGVIWNTSSYNENFGDPLQLSTSPAANFLQYGHY